MGDNIDGKIKKMEIDQIFNYIQIREQCGDDRFGLTYLNALKSSAERFNKYRIVVNLFDKAYSKLNKIDNGKETILFLGTRYLDLIKAVAMNYNVLILAIGLNDRINAIKLGLPYIGISHWHKAVLNGYYTPYLRREIMDKISKECISKIVNYKVKTIILWNDSLFMERIILHIFKYLGIPSVVIQHGLFQDHISKFVLDGHYSNYLMVWGKHFINYFYKKEVKEKNEIFEFGYPYIIRKEKHFNNNKNLCVVGSAHDLYDADKGKKELNTLYSICNLAVKYGFQVTYRPHPNHWKRNRPKELDKKIIIENNCPIHESVQKHAIFIGIDSTVLVETALQNCLTIQIIPEGFLCDRFEKKGICYTIDYDIKSIDSLLQNIIRNQLTPMCIDSSYISTFSSLEDMSNRLNYILERVN